MANDIQPVFKVVDYQIAVDVDEVNEMIESGYEPHGSAVVVHGRIKQPMVKREMISTEEYLKMMDVFLDVAEEFNTKIQERAWR